MSIIKILIHFEGLKSFNTRKFEFDKLIDNLIKNEGYLTGEINIIFCSDNYLLDINIQYLNHSYFTDIITFDYVENNVVSGDLYVSVDRVKENAQRFQTDFVNELYRVIFHGILHLVGYNDKTKSQQKRMKERENYYLEYLFT